MQWNSENGNVIIFIFIAIFLLGALTFSFTSSNRSSTAVITEAQADAYATQIVDFGNNLKQAVKRLNLRGCDDTEISFETTINPTSYINPNSPLDKSCHVFNNAGGSISYTAPPEGMLLEPSPMTTQYGDWFISGRITVSGFGSDWDDLSLTLVLPYVRKEVCMKINEKIGNTGFPWDTPMEDNTTTALLLDEPFVGSYNWGGMGDIDGWATGGGTDDYWNGVPSGCTLMTDGYYLYYKILLPRT